MKLTDEIQQEVRQYGTHEPFKGHITLIGIFGLAFLSVCAVSRGPGKASRIEEALLLAIATHKLTRIVSRDRVTAPFRAPFTRFEKAAGAGEVEEESRGEGLQKAIGELVTCPYCVAPWIAVALKGMHHLAPAATRTLTQVMAMVAASDFLNRLYSKLED